MKKVSLFLTLFFTFVLFAFCSAQSSKKKVNRKQSTANVQECKWCSTRFTGTGYDFNNGDKMDYKAGRISGPRKLYREQRFANFNFVYPARFCSPKCATDAFYNSD